MNVRPDPSFYPSPKDAMEAPAETLAFTLCQCRSKIPQKCRSNFPHFRDLVTSQIRGLS
jgi:hypothetical protein